jgi:hypothetical protein
MTTTSSAWSSGKDSLARSCGSFVLSMRQPSRCSHSIGGRLMEYLVDMMTSVQVGAADQAVVEA